MQPQESRFDLALCYVGVVLVSVSLAIPWVLAAPLSDAVAEYVRGHFNGKPLPAITEALLGLRPFFRGGALSLLVLSLISGVVLVRSSRLPTRNVLIFVLAAAGLTCLAFSFVLVALTIPFMLFTVFIQGD